MRVRALILVVLVISIGAIFTFSAFAQTQETISVATSKKSYNEGDTIVIYGQVSSIILDTPVTLQVFHEGNLVDIVSITVAQDGKFTHTMLAKGPLWQKDGTYIVRASYGASYMVETSFEYKTNPSVIATTDVFEVNAGSYGTFDVQYTVRGATVKSMKIDPVGFSLIVTIETKDDGSITLDLPRYGIDAKKNDGTDDSFIILIDGVEVPYKEISTNSNSRTITIEFEQGDSDIKIRGTVIAATPEPELKSTINVLTDKSSYDKGEIIKVSGEVTNPRSGVEVGLTVIGPAPSNNIVAVDQVNVDSFGKFEYQLGTTGDSWAIDGTYTIKVTYGNQAVYDRVIINLRVSDTPTPSPSTARVSVTRGSSVPGCEKTNECFIPYEIRVAVGGEVSWNNDDTAAHTVTSGTAKDGPDGNFDSSLFMAGTTFSVKFDNSGTYPYFCMVHPWMLGVVVVGQGGTSPPPPTPRPDISISVDSDSSLYDLGDIVNLSIKLSGTSKSQNVAVSVSDPTGHAVVSRTLTTDSSGMASTEFGIHEDFKTGTYSVAVTVSIGGVTYKDTTNFKIQSQFNQIKIISVEGTDQQGNTAPFTRGEIGFVKVVVSANKPIATLVTVNLFDSELTTIGIASFRTTLSTGESEMILSFLIPEDAAIGSADIYANAFSDWPSNGGVSLTGESSAQVRIS